MANKVSEGNLLTFKSQLDLKSEDLIAIRDTVTNNVSIGVNTIGDFDSYYISKAAPTFGSTFLGIDHSISSNIIGNPLGETQANEFTITNATATMLQYPSTPLIINGATATLYEPFTPVFAVDGATLTYKIENPIISTALQLELPLKRVMKNKVTKIEITPSMNCNWMSHCGTGKDAGGLYSNSDPKFVDTLINMGPIDVSFAFMLEGFEDPTNLGNLPIFFHDRGDQYSLGVCIVSNNCNTINSSLLLPLCWSNAGILTGVEHTSDSGSFIASNNVQDYYTGGTLLRYSGGYPKSWWKKLRDINGRFLSEVNCDGPKKLNTNITHSSDGRLTAANSKYTVTVTLTDGSSYTTNEKFFNDNITSVPALDGYELTDGYLMGPSHPDEKFFDYVDGYNLKTAVTLEITDFVATYSLPPEKSAHIGRYFETREKKVAPITYDSGDVFNELFVQKGYLYMSSNKRVDKENDAVYKNYAISMPISTFNIPSNLVLTNGGVNLSEIKFNSINKNVECRNNNIIQEVVSTASLSNAPSLFPPTYFPAVPARASVLHIYGRALLPGEPIPSPQMLDQLMRFGSASWENIPAIPGYYVDVPVQIVTPNVGDVETLPVDTVLIDSTRTSNLKGSYSKFSGDVTTINTTTFSVATPGELTIAQSIDTVTYTTTAENYIIHNLSISVPTGITMSLAEFLMSSYRNISDVQNDKLIITHTPNTEVQLKTKSADGYVYGIRIPIIGGGRLYEGDISLSILYKYIYNYPSSLTISDGDTSTVTPTSATIVGEKYNTSYAQTGTIGLNFYNWTIPLNSIGVTGNVITLKEEKNIKNYLTSKILDDQTIHINGLTNPVSSLLLYDGITSTFPVSSGDISISYAYQGIGGDEKYQDIITQYTSVSRKTSNINITSSDLFQAFNLQTLSLPSIFDITNFVRNKATSSGVTIGTIEYTSDGAIPALGLSATDLNYSRPDIDSVVYAINYKVGTEYYYTEYGVTGGKNNNVLISTDITPTNQTIFTMFDRERMYNSSHVETGVTMLYFTSVSKNASGYTFSLKEFPISDLNSGTAQSYYIYRISKNGLITAENGDNTNVSSILDINDFERVRTNIVKYNTASYNTGDTIPVSVRDKGILDATCDIDVNIDPLNINSTLINTIQVKQTGITGNIINNFVKVDNVYTLGDDSTTYSMYMFITPIITIVPPPIVIDPPPVAGSPDYPFWMQRYVQNANGSITGQPTFETAFLQKSFEYRTFSSEPTFRSDYYSTNPRGSVFSLTSATSNNYLVGNTYSALYTLKNTTVTSASPFQGITGVPSDLINGFMAHDYRFNSKIFDITTDSNKQVFVLPFEFQFKNGVYTVYYSNYILTYKHVNVNNADNSQSVWPVSVSTTKINNIGLYDNVYNYQIPAPLTVSSGSSSFCPTIIARPGFINIKIPYLGLYIKKNQNSGETNAYYTSRQTAIINPLSTRSAFPSNLKSTTNPAFSLKYGSYRLSDIFQRNNTDNTYELMLTSESTYLNTAVSGGKQRLGTLLYSNQVYENMSIQSYLTPNNISSVITDINDINSSVYLAGTFVLPTFYILPGIALTGLSDFITISSAYNSSLLGSSAVFTFDLASTATGKILFENQQVGYSNSFQAGRFALTLNPASGTTGGIVGPIPFDIMAPPSNIKMIVSLSPNTLYDNILLTYYPYLSHSNETIRGYNESIRIPKSFTSSAGTQFSTVLTIQKNDSKTYRLSMVNTGTIISNTFTPLTTSTSYYVVIDLTSNTSTYQPYISNTSTDTTNNVYNYSGNGLLYVPINASNLIQNNDGAVISFAISNLEEGATYRPKAYLASISNLMDKSNIIITPEFTVDIMPYSTSTGPLSTELSTTLISKITLRNFNIYDRLINTNYNLPNTYGGNLFIFNIQPSDFINVTSNNKHYGTVAVNKLAVYPIPSVIIPLNKPINTNTPYTLYAGYNPLPHSVTGWNQYVMTDSTRGERNLFKNATTVSNISFLKGTMLLATGLTGGNANTLCSMLGPDTAVIYGSSIMYTYKQNIGGQASDIDIMVKDKKMLKSIVDFIVSCNPVEAYVYDYFKLYTGSTGGMTNYSTNAVPTTNSSISTLVSSYAPTLGQTGGTFITSETISTDVNPDLDGIYKALTIKIGNNLPIQIVFVQPISIPEKFTLSEYAQYSSDLTVNAGTYDGSNLIIPYYRDIDQNIAVYRDNISDNRKWRTISRLFKYKSRGFSIFFESENQVNDWNSFKSGISDYDPWWTNATGSNPKPLNSCPFRVLNRISLLTGTDRSIIANTRTSNQETFMCTKITSTTQPSFGGSITVSGFDYKKNNIYSIPMYLGGSLSAINTVTGDLFGTVDLLLGVYPRDVVIAMNKAYIPTGSIDVTLIYKYDNPVIVAPSTQTFTYKTLDSTLILSTVKPLIHNIVVQIPSGTTFGGSALSTTQPVIQVKAVPISELIYQGEYDQGSVYNISKSLVTKSNTLYYLSGTNNGDPVNGNGWIDTTKRFLNFKGQFDNSVMYTEGDTVTYSSILYICTGGVNILPNNVAQLPAQIDINTGVVSNWSSDINTRYAQGGYTSPEYKLQLKNCIPNSEYAVFMQVQTGTTMSAPQKLSNIRTFPDSVSINTINTVTESLSYLLDKVHYDDGTSGVLITDGSFMPLNSSIGSTLTGTGVTITSEYPFNSVLYRPLNSITTGVFDTTIPCLIDDTYNYKFEAGITISNILPNSATVTISGCTATNFSLSGEDSILIMNTVTGDIPLQLLKIGNGLNITDNTITVNLTNLIEGTQYSLSAYYLIRNSSIYVPDRMNIGSISTPLTVSFTHLRLVTRNDFSIVLSNFIYKGIPLTNKVFPIDDTLNSVTAVAYNSNNPYIKYTATPTISGGNVYLKINALSISNSIALPVMNRFTLTYVNKKSDTSFETTLLEDILI